MTTYNVFRNPESVSHKAIKSGFNWPACFFSYLWMALAKVPRNGFPVFWPIISALIVRRARDQWLRAAQSTPLNIAEGNGKRSLKDRSRFLDITRGSALECVAIQDVLAATDGLNDDRHSKMKRMPHRIVSMLTRLIARSDVVAESGRCTVLESSTSPARLSTTTSTKKTGNQNQAFLKELSGFCKLLAALI
jgi:four helix bundle protein